MLFKLPDTAVERKLLKAEICTLEVVHLDTVKLIDDPEQVEVTITGQGVYINSSYYRTKDNYRSIFDGYFYETK